MACGLFGIEDELSLFFPTVADIVIALVASTEYTCLAKIVCKSGISEIDLISSAGQRMLLISCEEYSMDAGNT